MDLDTSRLLESISRLAHELPFDSLDSLCRELEVGGRSPAELQALLESRISSPAARQLLSDTLAAWEPLRSTIPVTALTLALRSSGRLDDDWRQSQSIEVVWTGPGEGLGRLRRTEQALLELIGMARSRLWIVSFSVGLVEAVEKVLLRTARSGVTVRLLLETPEDSGGYLQQNPVEQLSRELRSAATLLVWPRDKRPADEYGNRGLLHAKCAIADDLALFVSSANLSGAAMERNLEMGLLVKGGCRPGEMASHLDQLLHLGTLRPLT